jgi:hypothetical protein
MVAAKKIARFTVSLIEIVTSGDRSHLLKTLTISDFNFPSDYK